MNRISEDRFSDIDKIRFLLPRSSYETDVYALLYLAYKMCGRTIPECRLPKEILQSLGIKHQLWKYLTDIMESVNFEALCKLVDETDVASLREELLKPIHDWSRSRIASVPDLVNRLAAKILRDHIVAKSLVVELNCGDGMFLIEEEIMGRCRAIGIEPDKSTSLCRMMRADVVGCDIDIENKNPIDWFENPSEGKADGLFLNHQFGMRIKDIADDSNEFIFKVLEDNPEIKRSASSDWLFAKLCIDALTDTGKAICVFPRGEMTRNSSLAIRKSFIESGWIEAAISLPKGVYLPNASIATTLIVLSHGNESVHFIDASEIKKDAGWDESKQSFSNYSGSTVKSIFDEEICPSKTLSLDEVKETGYWLTF